MISAGNEPAQIRGAFRAFWHPSHGMCVLGPSREWVNVCGNRHRAVVTAVAALSSVNETASAIGDRGVEGDVCRYRVSIRPSAGLVRDLGGVV